jgi:hypothetical protein
MGVLVTGREGYFGSVPALHLTAAGRALVGNVDAT